jgi:hypothetical protein
MARDSIVHFEDAANRLDFNTLQRVVHFHLKIHFTPIHKMKQDLSEKAFNHLDLTVPPILCYHLLSVPHGWTLNHTQSRQSPYCHKAALEVHLNMDAILISWILSGRPEQYPELHICTSMCPRTQLLHFPLHTIPPR